MNRVWNVRDPDCPLDAVYVGRGTPYGNPFRIGDPMTEEHSLLLYGRRVLDGRPMTRNEVISLYDLLVIPSLDVSGLVGKDVKCHCKPLRCHGDLLVQKAFPGLNHFLD